MPAPPSYQKVNPGDQPVMQLVLHSSTLPLSTGRRVRGVDDRAAHLDGAAASRRCRWSARRSTRCASISTRATSSAHGIGIDEAAAAIQNVERQPADRDDLRRRPHLHDPGQRAAAARARVRARRSSPTATATRCGSTRSRTSTTASRTTSRRLVQRRARASRCRSRSSRAPTSSRSSTPSRRCCRQFRAQLPPAITLDIRSDRSIAIRESVPRRQVHAAAHDRARRAGHLPVPAQRLGDGHPQPGAALLDRRRPSR